MDVSAVVTGAQSSGAFAFTTINGATHASAQSITFDAFTIGENFTSSAVNVATATSLANALDIAAGQAGAVAAGNGVVEWFQYGGNTYLVDAIGGAGAHTGTAATDALQATDIVVKLTGLANLTRDSFGGGHSVTI